MWTEIRGAGQSWHADGEHYYMQHIQLLPSDSGFEVRVRRTSSWALTGAEITEQANAAGFTSLTWHTPEDSGFFQPVLTGRARPAVDERGRHIELSCQTCARKPVTVTSHAASVSTRRY